MKKKLQTRFPATRIKKIMQTDEDIGKMAMAVPLLISKALELFLQELCNHTYDITLRRGSKTVNSFHLKQCVQEFNIFDFLKDIVSKVPDLGELETEDRSATKRRKVIDEGSCNDEDTMKTIQMHDVKHTGGVRGKQSRGHSKQGSGRIGWGLSLSLSLKIEDDVEDVSPRSSMSQSSENLSLSLSPYEKPECIQVVEHNNDSKSRSKVRNFDLNVALDENGEYATSFEERLEGIKMKIEPYQQQTSGSEEDYDL